MNYCNPLFRHYLTGMRLFAFVLLSAILCCAQRSSATLYPCLSGATVGTATSIYSGDSATLTLTGLTGTPDSSTGGWTANYQWQKYVGATWTNIPGATGVMSSSVTTATYNTGGLTATTQYRVVLSGIVNDCFGPTITSLTTSSVAITITAVPAIGGPATVCYGSTATETDAVSGGTWTSNNPAVASIDPTTGIVTGVVPGTATISYTIAGGFLTYRNISVLSLPAAITGLMTLCPGYTTTLHDSLPGGNWHSGDVSVASITYLTGIATGMSAGTATISYTTTCGTVTSVMTVGPFVSSVVGNPVVCTGLTTTLADTIAGGTWSSSNTAIATMGSGTGLLTGVSPGTATISYTTTCGSATVTATVDTLLPPITGTMLICPGTTTTLADAVTGGTWSSSNMAIATVGSGSGIVTGVAGGTVRITYTGSCAISTIITVNPAPAAIAGLNHGCVGAADHLTDATGGGLWISSNTAIGTVGTSSGIVTGIAVGSTIITYLLSTGCYTVTAVTINTLPAVVTGTFVFCAGTTDTLHDTTPGGTWSSSSPSIATVDSITGIATGVGGGSIGINYTLLGCSSVAVITVNPLPNAGTITGSPNTCVGNSITISHTVGLTGGVWSSSNASASIAGAGGSNLTVTGVTVGIDTIRYTMTNICGSASASIIVTINPQPAAITGTLSLCAGNTTALSDTTAGGTWSSGNPAIATVGSVSGMVTGVAGGAAGISYTNALGCRSTAIVTVNPLPNPGTITGNLNTCVSSSTTLSHPTGMAGGVYSRSNSDAYITGIGWPDFTATGVATGIDTITYTITNVCGTSSTSFVVTVNAQLGTITGTLNACVGATRTLNDSTAGGTWWSSNPTIVTVGSGTGVVTAVSGGSADISYTSILGCSVSGVFTVTPLANAGGLSGPSAVCLGSEVNWSHSAIGGVWTRSDSDVSITPGVMATVIHLTGVQAGIDTVFYTVTNACNSATVSKVISVNPLPAVISGSLNVCVGATTTLSDSTTGGTWASGNTLIATIGVSSGTITGVGGGGSSHYLYDHQWVYGH